MDTYTIRMPKSIKNDFEGFNLFSKIFNETNDETSKVIRLDFSRTTWFEANLSAVLGTWASKMFRQGNKIQIYNIAKSIRRVLQKNGFYERFNLETIADTYSSTIKYFEFDISEQEKFSKYLTNEVIPNIKTKANKKVLKSLKLSINEVFTNVEFHADSKTVYTCGQYYHENKKVAFTISDLGKTIGNNVRKYQKDNSLTDVETIAWAILLDSSTKSAMVANDEAGGIGLYLIHKFIYNNEGILQIISGNGFYELNNGMISKRELDFQIPGTIVNMITKLEYSLIN
ncbi:hypothetical protein D6T70_06385 [Kurthia gibsonii]|uniref:hypothetical protein n=1 Tax=Kurthia gibsonii TaxID=33946 RepID=UPI000EAC1D09|nr:hypothetical protein [Kurthia gibsonii]RXH52461.1 hypothetical protein D6T70_06385 [Kurthia gibsonii]